MIKKLFGAVIGAGLILASTAPAFAGYLNVFNTGASSNVISKIDRLKNHVFTVTNSNNLNQTVNSTFSSGNNAANNNTKDGLTAGGNVTKNETQLVEANTTNVDIDVSDNATSPVDNVTVNWTGAGSNVTATVNDTKNVTFTITNSGFINNVFNSSIDSGNNSASNNTGNGTAAGGDIFVNHTITTKLNALMFKLRM